MTSPNTRQPCLTCGHACVTRTRICRACQWRARHNASSDPYGIALTGGYWEVRRGVRRWVWDEEAA